MKVVVQRAVNASCTVDGKVTGNIEMGLLLLVGFTEGDGKEQIEYMAKKIVNLRIFEDNDKVMNKNVLEVKGSILSISQFTLYADTRKGNRPSYGKAMNFHDAKILYELFNQELKKYCLVESGVFGADMQVAFCNNGPVTILLER